MKRTTKKTQEIHFGPFPYKSAKKKSLFRWVITIYMQQIHQGQVENHRRRENQDYLTIRKNAR